MPETLEADPTLLRLAQISDGLSAGIEALQVAREALHELLGDLGPKDATDEWWLALWRKAAEEEADDA